jgi:hypothetical protein
MKLRRIESDKEVVEKEKVKKNRKKEEEENEGEGDVKGSRAA